MSNFLRISQIWPSPLAGEGGALAPDEGALSASPLSKVECVARAPSSVSCEGARSTFSRQGRRLNWELYL